MNLESNSPAQLWGGRIAGALPVLGLVASAVLKLLHGESLITQFTTHFGYPESVLTPLGILELLCAILYCVPQTSVLGAVLLTGYLGGAVATHVRIGEPPFIPVVFGVLLWAGLYLRDGRIRALLPLTK